MSRDAKVIQAHFLGALSRRMQNASPAVRQVLHAKHAHALAASQALEDAPAPPAVASAHAPQMSRARPKAAAAAPVSPLALLNQQVVARNHATPGGNAELRSVRRFRETWSRLSAEDEVAEAVQRGPENAGPLNSHMLVLRTLGLLRERSPDYLQRFMSHADTLLWLEQATGRLKTTAVVKTKPTKTKK